MNETTNGEEFDSTSGNDILQSEEAWSLFSLGIVVLVIGSPLSTLVAINSSVLAKKEYASFINVLIALYTIAMGNKLFLQSFYNKNNFKRIYSSV